MKIILALAALAAIGSLYYMRSTATQTVLEVESVEKLFENFVLYNRKSYASLDEFQYRLNVFKNNLKLVEKLQQE